MMSQFLRKLSHQLPGTPDIIKKCPGWRATGPQLIVGNNGQKAGNYVLTSGSVAVKGWGVVIPARGSYQDLEPEPNLK